MEYIKSYIAKTKKSKIELLDLGCGDANDIFALNKIFSDIEIIFTGVDLGKKLIDELNQIKEKIWILF